MHTTNKNIKAVILCRVSSKEQEETEYSLDSQEKLLTEYANKNEYKVIKIYSISESASGKQVRKIFNEMIQFTTKNRAAVILCEKIDRLTRNPKDAVMADDWVKEDPSRSIHFVKENLILSSQTKAHENLVWDMKVAIARFYANNLSEEVRKGQKEKIAQGWLPMRAKTGYKCEGEKGHIIHVIDDNKAPLIKKMFELYSTGNYSLTHITKIMKEEGLRNEKNAPISRTRIHELLSDPFYYGLNVWMGEKYTNSKHVPLISEGLFNSVQKKLCAKFGGHPMYSKHEYIFKAKIKCAECGGTITWECQKGHWYGHCNHYKNCSQEKWVKQYEVEEQLFPIFAKLAPKGENVLKVLEETLKDSHSNEIDYNANKQEELNKVIQIADKRIEGAYRDKLDGRMPPQLCEKIIKESTEEKENTIKSLSKLNENRFIYYQAGISIHELIEHAKEIYESEKSTIEDKRLLLSQLFSNLTLNEGKIEAKYTPASEFLAEWMPKLNFTFEPAKKTDFPREMAFSASRKCPWRG